MTSLNHSLKSFILVISVLVSAVGCTQKLGRIPLPIQRDQGLVPLEILEDITYEAKLIQSGGYLYATGGGEGFGTYNLNSFAFFSGRGILYSSQGGHNFFGNSTPKSVTAMVKTPSYLVISSGTGLTLVDVSNPAFPRVDSVLTGPGTLWTSAVYDPSSNKVLGFIGNQMFKLDLTLKTLVGTPQTIPDLSCGRGATQFNGKIYIAGCNSLWEYSGGSFKQFYYAINAIDVVGNNGLLYVHHRPVRGIGGVNVRAGIYVYDVSSTSPSYQGSIPLDPESFAISQDNQYIFSNDNDEDVAVYRIP
jgi:hypothetical protein